MCQIAGLERKSECYDETVAAEGCLGPLELEREIKKSSVKVWRGWVADP